MGTCNGIVILISQECEPLYKKFHEKFPAVGKVWLYKVFQILRTILLMSTLRMFDNYQGCKAAVKAYIDMFAKWDVSKVTMETLEYLELSAADLVIVVVGVICMFTVSMVQRKGSVREQISKLPFGVKYIIFAALFFAVVLFGKYGLGYEASSFIYNQF